MGFESVGFQTVGYEIDAKATETYNQNLKGKCFAEKLIEQTAYKAIFDVVIGTISDMQRVRLKDGRGRRISVREVARLQSFPDWFEFVGTETQQYYPIGNAVPPLLAWHSIKNYLLNDFEPQKFVKKQPQSFQTSLF